MPTELNALAAAVEGDPAQPGRGGSRRRDAGARSQLAVHLRPVVLRPRLERRELQQHRRLRVYSAAVYAPRSPLSRRRTGRDHFVLLGRPARDRRERIPRDRQSVAGLAVKLQKQSIPPAQTARRTAPRSSSSRPSGGRRPRVPAATDSRWRTTTSSARSSTTWSPTRRRTRATPVPGRHRLYWRVRADDENLIGLNWSETRTFRRRLPRRC